MYTRMCASVNAGSKDPTTSTGPTHSYCPVVFCAAWYFCPFHFFFINKSIKSHVFLSISLQLAFCSGEHQVATAPVFVAEGGAARGQRRGPRPPARPGALLRRLGPHAPDRGSVQTAAGPILPHYRGKAIIIQCVVPKAREHRQHWS